MSTDLVVARGRQIVGLLLTTVPLAERMLLYNMVLAALIMLPERSRLRAPSFARTLVKWGRVPQVRQNVPGPKKTGRSPSTALGRAQNRLRVNHTINDRLATLKPAGVC
jgi:hypothetical protein